MANNTRLCLFFFAFLLLALEATDARFHYQGKVESSSVTVTFRLQQHVEFGQGFVVVGNTDELGNWNTAKGLLLNYSATDVWSKAVNLSGGSKLEIKVARVVYDNPSQILEWYNGKNFPLLVPSDEPSVTVLLDWCSSSSSSSSSSPSSSSMKEEKKAVGSGSSVGVQFQMKEKVEFGQRFGICGNQDPLGNWATDKSSLMDYIDDDVWVTSSNVELATGLTIEYKALILVYNTNQFLQWMPGQNRKFVIPTDITDKFVIVLVAWNACPSSTLFEDTIVSKLEII